MRALLWQNKKKRPSQTGSKRSRRATRSAHHPFLAWKSFMKEANAWQPASGMAL